MEQGGKGAVLSTVRSGPPLSGAALSDPSQIVGATNGHRSSNPAQSLEFHYGPEGFAVAAHAAEGSPRATFTLRSVDRGAAPLRLMSPPQVREAERMLEYDHGDFTLRYTASAHGMRHDVVVHREPEGHGPLEARFALESDLLAVQQDADEILLYGADPATGRMDPLIRYNGLKAWDADGVVLASRMELKDGAVVLSVDAGHARYPVTIDPMTSSANLTLAGTQANELLGMSVATAGDVNGDGYSDLIVGSPGWNTPAPGAGRVQVYLGSATGLSSTPAWSYEGSAAGDSLGFSVSTAGDMNADGFSDVIVGAPGANGKGMAYVFLGNVAGLSATPSLSLQGDNQSGSRFGHSVALYGEFGATGRSAVLVGAPRFNDVFGTAHGKVYCYKLSLPTLVWFYIGTVVGGQVGFSVAGPGDMDGDGFPEVAVGSPFRNKVLSTGVGAVFVFKGNATGSFSTMWMKEGTGANANFGYSVAGAGDVDGDGLADLIIGAPGTASGKGAAHLYRGDPTNGLVAFKSLNSSTDFDRLGHSVARAGDVNGDGYADFLVGVPGYGSGKGRVQLYRGSSAFEFDNAHLVLNLTGTVAAGRLGTAVATCGDVDGDGISDVVLAAPWQDGAGNVRVHHGATGLLQIEANWSIEGTTSYEEQGNCVASAGDVNGDGYADVLVSNRVAGGSPGEVRLYLGGSGGLGAAPAWVKGSENPGDRFGESVATAGDVNGDGYSDVLVGAPAYRRTGDPVGTWRGKVYLYLGSPSGLAATPVWTMEGEAAESRLGWSLSTAGDVNGDGYSDVIIGAYTYGGRGKAYVYHGSPAGVPLPATPDWATLGSAAVGSYASSVSLAGDVNGDGYDDVIVGDPYWEPGTTEHNLGAAFVFHGSPTGLSSTPDWVGYGAAHNYFFGSSVSYAGDVNGDGHSDVIIGAPQDNLTNGKAYVYHGSPNTGLASTPATVFAGVSPAPNEQFGGSVSAVGDVNGDGFADVVVGASRSSVSYLDQGAVFLYLGSSAGINSTAAVSLAPINRSNAGFGNVVAGAGDVNGDGYGDLITAARNPTTTTVGGGAYLFMGNKGPGLARPVYQYRPDLVTPVRTSNGTFSPGCTWGIGHLARSSMGRSKLKLAWQQYGHGPSVPFVIFDNHSTAYTGQGSTWTDSQLQGQLLKASLSVAGDNTSHPMWRVRVRHHPASMFDGRPFDRWFAQGVHDMQVPSLKVDLAQCGPLPVTLVDANVECHSGAAVIQWTTASEQNCKEFQVQSSVNMHDWTTIAHVGCNTNSNQLLHYRYQDRSVPGGLVYYRLRQVDHNGASEEFPVLVLAPCTPGTGLHAWPNPFVDVLHIRLPAPMDSEITAQVIIRDLAGRVIGQQQANFSGNGVAELSRWSEIPPGAYSIEVQNAAGLRLGQVQVMRVL